MIAACLFAAGLILASTALGLLIGPSIRRLLADAAEEDQDETTVPLELPWEQEKPPRGLTVHDMWFLGESGVRWR